MPNITISIEDELLKASREYAKNHQTSLNDLIRRLLKSTVQCSGDLWLDECFELMDRAGGNSRGKKWSREELQNDLNLY